MKTLLIISTFLSLLYACSDRQQQMKSDKLFNVTYHLLDVNSNIRNIRYHHGYYLLQLNNNNYAVLDTNFKQHKNIEYLLANTKTTLFYKRGDTTILALETKDFRRKEFQLTNDFTLTPLTSPPLQ